MKILLLEDDLELCKNIKNSLEKERLNRYIGDMLIYSTLMMSI